MLTKSKISVALAGFCLSSSTLVSAVPLSLANSPLIAAQAVDPNIMVLFDTSGSMQHIVPQAPYDASNNYATCPSDRELSTTNEYRLDVRGDGDVEIRRGSSSTRYEWGTADPYRCFDPSETYRARLVETSENPGDGALYSGNYLNWYFSNSSQTGPANWGSGTTRRPGVQNRNEVARDALTMLIGAVSDPNRLQDVRMGLAGFDSGDSEAEFISKLVDLNIDANRTMLLSAVNSLDAAGGTPLASALASLGHYFIDGHEGESIDSDNDGDIDGNENADYDTNGELFDNDPDYSGLADPTAPVANEVMQYSCQKNFIVALTDGVPTGDSTYHSVLAGWNDGSETNDDDPGDFDDIAEALYDLDLRSSTYPNDHNNITTYPIGFSINLPMLQRAADNSGGQYYTANDADQLSNALQAIANDVQAQVSTTASVAFNSGRLVTGSSVFQAKFDTANYSGEMLAFDLQSDGSITATETWEAGAKLDALTDAAAVANRKIFTYDNSLTNPDGIPFLWANLNASQKDDLAYPLTSADATYDTDGEKLLEYIRGNTSNEGLAAANFRQRDSRLGDIVNSTPVFVGPPELNWPDHSSNNLFGSSTSSYSDYKTAQASRSPVLYVGANDGMLHGFSAGSTASDGVEVFAYIPGEVFSSANANSGLHYLASQNYDHKFYVDLTPTVSDVFIPNVTAGTSAWRTVLIGGTRGGGRGLFALDVSNPAFTASADLTVLWEFTSADDPDFGYTYSQPSIVMMPNGRWAAITGNGYNSNNENAYLFIIFLDGGLDGVWSLGTDYLKYAVDNSLTSNGLSTPRVVDLDGDLVADRIYAGDLQGNMWVFDVQDPTVGNWGLASSSPLFKAVSDNGTPGNAGDDYPQPITSAPILAENSLVTTSGANEPNVLVLFGTGKFLEPSDTSTNFDVQSYYGVWDSGAYNLNRSNLVSRELVTETIQVDDPASDDPTVTIDKQLRRLDASTSSVSINYAAGGDYGWYFDLEDKTTPAGTPSLLGERVVTDSLLRREVLFFNTIIPDNVACSGGGTGWLMSLDFLTGLAPSFGVFDANNDGDIDALDQGYVGEQFLDGIPSKSGVLGDYQYTPGSKGSIEKREIEVGGGLKEGKLSWEELFRN